MLVARHAGLAQMIANEFFLPGSDREDVVQEAMIGLLVAIRMYDGKGAFYRFAVLVIRRWLSTELKSARCGKRRLLTESVRVMHDKDSGIDYPAAEQIEDPRGDVVDLLSRREDFARLIAATHALSDLEREGLRFVIDGVNYSGNKRIDNAIQRAREKLRDAA